jgi:hypothetical protein
VGLTGGAGFAACPALVEQAASNPQAASTTGALLMPFMEAAFPAGSPRTTALVK